MDRGHDKRRSKPDGAVEVDAARNGRDSTRLALREQVLARNILLEAATALEDAARELRAAVPGPINSATERLVKKLLRSVDTLGLSARALNCLGAAEIRTIGHLIQYPNYALLKSPNFGRRSVREIEDALRDIGLSLGMRLSPEVARALQVRWAMREVLALP